jgi:hypothetical protein
MDVAIGNWVYRWHKGRVTKDHLIESLVADDIITRCGRRMSDEDWFVVVGDWDRVTRCQQCQSR